MKKALAPLHVEIDRIHRNAWSRWNALPHPDQAALSRFKRGRANVVWSFIIDEASRAFSALPQIEESDEEDQQRIQTVIFHVNRNGTVVVIRFKKMDPAGGTRNVETYRQYSIIGMLDLPEIPTEGIRVTIGYVENATATGVSQILVKNDDRDDQWVYEIPGSDADDVVGLSPEQTPSPTEPTARVRARQEKETKDNDQEADIGSD